VTLMLILKRKFESNFPRSFMCFIFQKRVGFLLTTKNSSIFRSIISEKGKFSISKVFSKKLFWE
jgi:hypothetical protein